MMWTEFDNPVPAPAQYSTANAKAELNFILQACRVYFQQTESSLSSNTKRETVLNRSCESKTKLIDHTKYGE